MKKKWSICTNLIIISLIIFVNVFSRTKIFTKNEGNLNNVNLGANATYSFDFIVDPEESKVKSGETVELDINLDNISMGEKGINNVVGFISYDESLYESLEIKSANADWNYEQNEDKNHKWYGKFVVYSMREKISQNENIIHITAKLKENLKPQITEINFKNLKSSNGDFSVDEEDKKAIIIIYDEGQEPTPTPTPTPTSTPTSTPTPGEENPTPKEPTPVPTINENTPNINEIINNETVKTGDKIIVITIALVLLLIAFNMLVVAKSEKIKDNKTTIKVLTAISTVLLISSIVLISINTIASNDNYEKLFGRLSIEEKLLNSEKYLVTDNEVSRVEPGTSVYEVKNKFNKTVTVLENNNGTTAEVTSGIVTTNMIIRDDEEAYPISVWGDLDEDGYSNHIELTSIIRNVTDSNKWAFDELRKKSADMNVDGFITSEDINTSVHYILYDEYNIPGFESVQAPTVSIIEGIYNETLGAYENNIKVKITENGTNVTQTKYKIEGTKEVGYTSIENNGVIEFKDDGLYKVSAYSYGKLGNRSEISYTIFTKRNPYANYKINYFKENVDGTYEKTEENKVGIIGNNVSAEEQKYLGYSINKEKSNESGIITEDGSLVLNVYYDRNEYTVTLKSGENVKNVSFGSEKASTLNKRFKFGKTVNISAELNDVNGYRIQWKEWESSNKEVLSNQSNQEAEFTMPMGDIELTAKTLKTINQYNYTVEYYYENEKLDSSTYVADFGSVINSFEKRSRIGYEYDRCEPTSLKIGSDESKNVIKVYYTAIKYNIDYDLKDGTIETSKSNPVKYTVATDSFTLNNPVKEGYTFAGWYGGVVDEDGDFDSKAETGTSSNISINNPMQSVTIEKGSVGNRKYIATWVNNTDTRYTIEHYLEKLDGTFEKDNIYTQVKYGITGNKVSASYLDIEGYSKDIDNLEKVEEGNIKADGTLILKLYYKRNEYSLKITAGENISGVKFDENGSDLNEITRKFKFGTQVNMYATLADITGYTTIWNEWESSNKTLIPSNENQIATIVMPMGDVEFTAKANKKVNKYSYKIEYYYDNVKNDEKTVTLQANYGEIINNYPDKNILGYEFDKTDKEALTISANEDENILKVYYKKVEYTIEYELNGGTGENGTVLSNPEKYSIVSDSFTLNNPVKEGYTFDGWYGGVVNSDGNLDSSVITGTTGNISEENPEKIVIIEKGSVGNRKYIAKWKANDSTKYIVMHYLEKLDGTFEFTESEDLVGETNTKAVAVPKNYKGYIFDDKNENNLLEGIIVSDGSLVLKVYYKRAEYTLTLVAGDNIKNVKYILSNDVTITDNGTNISGKFKFGTQLNISAELDDVKGANVVWNSWESNNSEILVNQPLKEALIGMPIGDVTLTAKATASINNYDYKIEYYYDDIKDETKTVEGNSKYGTQIKTYPNKMDEGYEFDKVEPAILTVSDNEEDNVMKVYYKLAIYDITYDLDNGEIAEGEENPTTYTIKSETINLNNPTKLGYEFLGWTGSNGDVPSANVSITKGSTGNKHYVANWKAKDDTNYTVEHYKENLDGTYTKADSEVLFGKTGATVTAEAKNYEGFELDINNENQVKSGVVLGNGSLVLKLYYNRKVVNITVNSGENISSVELNGESGTTVTKQFKYGEQVRINATEAIIDYYNVTWLKWQSSDTTVVDNKLEKSTSFEAPYKDINLTATASKTEKIYNYRIEYYYDNELNDNNTVTLQAKYREKIKTYPNKIIDGYEFDKIETTSLIENNDDEAYLIISNDEEQNIIKVYYKLIDYSIIYILNGGEMGEESNPNTYNIKTPTFTLKNPTKQGYVFLGWTENETDVPRINMTIVEGTIGNKTFEANWRANNDTVYKVEHYIEKLDSTQNPSEDVESSNFELHSVDGEDGSLVGTTDTKVSGQAKTILGFTYNQELSSATSEGIVASDGSLVLKLYYTRNMYNLKLIVGENIGSVLNNGEQSTTSIEKTYKYEEKVNINATLGTVIGHITKWYRWESNNTELFSHVNDMSTEITIPAGNVELTAKGNKEKANFAYSVQYYYDGVEDEDVRETGMIALFESQVISYTEKEKIGYVFDKTENLPLTISANSSENVIKVYYKLQEYSIEYDLGEGMMEEGVSNPNKYTIKTDRFALNAPIRDNYIFKGWIGGVVDSEGNIDNNAEHGTSGNIEDPTINVTIEKGSVGNRKYIANWEEKAFQVIVHHYLEKTGPEFNNDPVKVAEDEILTSKVIGAEYQTKHLIPTYDEQGNIIETDDRNYIDGTEFYFVSSSENITGVFTEENIEVYYYYQHHPVVKIIDSEDSSLIGTTYITIQDALTAIEAAGLNKESGITTIQVIREVKDESVVVDDVNVKLDLNGYNITSKSEDEPTFNLKNTKFTIVDDSNTTTTKVVSEKNEVIVLDANSEFTLGMEEKPIHNYPVLDGKTRGVKKLIENNSQGIFNFYDGIITAEYAIEGTVDSTPLLYNATISNNEIEQVAILSVVSNVEARIGSKTYMLLEDAVADANVLFGDDGSQVEIVLLKDVVKEQKIDISGNKNIKLDLAGFKLTNTVEDYVLENNGKLEIVDSTVSNRYNYLKYAADTNIVVGTISGKGVINSKDLNFDFNIENTGEYSLNIKSANLNRKSDIYLDGNIIGNIIDLGITNGNEYEVEINLGELFAGSHNIRFYSGTSSNGPDFKSFEINSKIGNGEIIGSTYTAIKNGFTQGDLLKKYSSSDLQSTNTYQFVQGEDDSFVSNLTGKTGQAHSYVVVDLTNVTEDYVVTANAEISCGENTSYGFITVNESKNEPSYSTTAGRFVYITGEVEAKDYVYELKAGKLYYIHLGYKKNNVQIVGEDRFKINSLVINKKINAKLIIKDCKIQGAKSGTNGNLKSVIENYGDIVITSDYIDGNYYMHKGNSYGFKKVDGKYYSNCAGLSYGISNSYIEIDLTGISGTHTISINALLSDKTTYNYGYATIKEDKIVPAHSEENGRFMYLNGNTAANDYSTEIEGGKKYYLHLGHFKGSDGRSSSHMDALIINSISIDGNPINAIEVPEPYIYSDSTKNYFQLINNNGKVIMNAGELDLNTYNSVNYGINNSGYFEFNGGIIGNRLGNYSVIIREYDNKNTVTGTIINGGTFKGSIQEHLENKLVINKAYGANPSTITTSSSKASYTIKDGSYYTMIDASNSGNVEIENGRFYTGYNSSLNASNGKILIKDGYFDIVIYCGKSIEIEKGTFKRVINANTSNGSLIIHDGNFSNEKGHIINQTYPTEIEIFNGTFKVTGETSGSHHILNLGSSSNVVIHSGNFEIDYGHAIYNGNEGTVIIGDKDGNVSISSPSIISEYNYGIYNEYGSLYYYDGIIKGTKSIYGQVNEIEDNVDIDISNENDLEVATLKAPTNPVAKIGDNQYLTLKDAVEACQDNVETRIDIIRNFNTARTVTIPENKNITISFEGNEVFIYANDGIVINNGTLSMIDNQIVEHTTIMAPNALYENRGIMTMDGLIVETTLSGKRGGTKKKGIKNTGTLNIDNSLLKGYANYYGVYNTDKGIINIENMNIEIDCKNSNDLSVSIYNEQNAKINARYINNVSKVCSAIYNYNNGEIKIEKMDSESRLYFLYNESVSEKAFELNAGSIKNTYGQSIYNKNSGTIRFDNLNAEALISLEISGSILQNEKGNVYFNGVNGNQTEYSRALYIGKGAYCSIENSNITAPNEVIDNRGTIDVLSGYLKSKNKIAIVNNDASAIIRIGAQDHLANKDNPIIEGKTNAISNPTAQFYFYGGTLIGAAKNSINGIVTAQEEGFSIVKENTDTIETAYLESLPVVEKISTGETYTTLKEAIDSCDKPEQLNLLQDLEYTSNEESLIIAEDKNIILDIKQHKINFGNENSIIVNGTLKLLNTERSDIENLAEEKLGIIKNANMNLIKNNGHLIIDGPNIENIQAMTSSSNYNNVIENKGILEFNSGSMESNGKYNNMIYNYEDGKFIFNGGNINSGLKNESYSRDIYNIDRAYVEIAGGSIIKTNGSNYNILNESEGIQKEEYPDEKVAIYMSSGSMIGSTHYPNIQNASSATIVISGTADLRKYNDYKYGVIQNDLNGIIRIEGGTLVGGNKLVGEAPVINNKENGKVIISDGNIRGCIDNVKNGIIDILGGNIETNLIAIVNSELGNVTIQNASVKSTTDIAIENKGSGKIVNSIIEGKTIGVRNYGQIELGTTEQNLEESTLVISGEEYGVAGNGTIKYFDGNTIGNRSIVGRVIELRQGYEVILDYQESLEKSYIGNSVNVASINDRMYNTIQEAYEACGDEETTIVLLKSIAIPEQKKLVNSKNIIIDMNGKEIRSLVDTEMINNSGILHFINSTNEKNSSIFGQGNQLITNTGKLNIIDISLGEYDAIENKLIYLKEDGSLVGDNITLDYSVEIKTDSYGIYSESSGDISLKDLTINYNGNVGNMANASTGYGIYINNESENISNINVQNYTYLRENDKGKVRAIHNIKGSVFNLTGELNIPSIFNEYGEYPIYSESDLNVYDANLVFKKNDSTRAFYLKGNTNINNVISNGLMYLEGATMTIDGENTLIENRLDLYNKASVIMNNGKIIYDRSSNSQTIYISESSFVMNNGILEGTNNIKGISECNGSTVVINDGKITTQNTYAIYLSNAKDITNIYGGNIETTANSAIYINQGTLNLGKKEYPVLQIPRITATNFGVENNKGTFNFYDGYITSTKQAINGTVGDTPELYKVYYENEAKIAYLGLEALSDQVALMNGILYNTLQNAIDSAKTSESVIKVKKNIILSESIKIAENQNITIDLGGNSIIMPSGNYTIINNGILNIIDTELIDNTSTIYSKIENKIGTAIYNSGTLTIGINDNTLYEYTPYIIGIENAIENIGTLNIYDGQIQAKTNPIGGTNTNVITSNLYNINVVDKIINEEQFKVLCLSNK